MIFPSVKIWGLVLSVGALVALTAGVYTTGYQLGKQGCTLRVNKAVQIIKDQAAAKALKLTKDNADFTTRLDRENYELREKLQALFDDIPVCYYSDDAILQLNKARGVSEAASMDAATAAAPATHLSRSGAADEWARDGKAYQECIARVNAFIEWFR